MIKISVLEINLNAIKNNINVIKTKLNRKQKLCMVIKANAYGFGGKTVSKFCNGLVDYFAVSCAREYYEIITNITKPVLILEPVYEGIESLIESGAELTISNYESLDKVLLAASKSDKYCKVHIAINSGMNRFGFKRIIDILNVVNILQKTQNIVICGVFSHYFMANDKYFAEKQSLFFKNIKEKIDGILPNCLFHICATDGVVFNNCFDMVRVGIGCYTDKLFQTITLKSKLVDIQILEKGECAGYSAIFVAKRKTKLGVVCIGYGDGIMRNIVQKGYVLINKCCAKIVAVCMDCLLVDITEISAKIYDDVIIIGRDGDKQIFICDVASWCDTIEYEIIVRIADRVERKYIGWIMQIITGKYRARKLESVAGDTTRPTLARVKESVFNLIQFDIAGSVVLDLFAGSGAFGAECISRGAKKVVFVDKEKKAVSTIQKNTKGMVEDFEILNLDFESALNSLARKNIKFDIVYLDPPYSAGYYQKALEMLDNLSLLNTRAIIVVESDSIKTLQNLPKCYIIKKSKKYGIAFVDVLTYNC